MELSHAVPASSEWAALAALMAASTWLGLSDWRSRTIGPRAVFTCYAAATAVNAGVVIIMMMATTAGAGDVASGLVATAGPTIIVIALLSCAIIAFWRLGLLASGDAYAIPALLSMLLFVAAPAVVVAYFIAAMAFVLAISVVENVRNNMCYRDRLYGPLWHRLYLTLFCYYYCCCGDGSQIRYAFMYNDDDNDRGGDGDGSSMAKRGSGSNNAIRRDYDNEPFYAGKEKNAWLVPGLPLLSGFAPATAIPILSLII